MEKEEEEDTEQDNGFVKSTGTGDKRNKKLKHEIKMYQKLSITQLGRGTIRD